MLFNLSFQDVLQRPQFHYLRSQPRAYQPTPAGPPQLAHSYGATRHSAGPLLNNKKEKREEREKERECVSEWLSEGERRGREREREREIKGEGE